MLMWAMSDRAIPRSYRMMQGFGVHTFRLVNAAGRVALRQVPLERRGRHAFAGVGRSGEDLRRRSGLPSPRSVGSDRGGRLSGVGARRADLHRGAGRGLHLRRARRDQDRARGAGAGRPGRQAGAEPQPGQLLRRDRAGRVLRRARRARASTSATIRCSPAASTPTWTRRSRGSAEPNFHEIPINAPIAQVHNNQRDGMHRQAINRGRVVYEPNSLGGGCPFQAGAAGFVSFPEPREAGDHKVRGKAERFADHYTQATLFWNSQTAVEKHAHHQRVPLRAVARADAGGARAHGVRPDERRARAGRGGRAGLGMRETAGADAEGADAGRHAGSHRVAGAVAVRAARRRQHPRRAASRSWSPTASTAARCARSPSADRRGRGAALRRRRARRGRAASRRADRGRRQPIEATPSVLFDARRPAGRRAAVEALRADGRTLEFLKDQYRHCKPILALGAGAESAARRRAFPARCRTGQPIPGCVVDADAARRRDAFIAALAKHRHFERETDPPRV